MRFKYALDSLEQEMKPIDLSLAAENDLAFMSLACRRFFDRANVEIFSQQKVSVLNGK